MKCTILHDIPGRMRVHLCCGRMTLHHADVLEYYLRTLNGVQSVKVYVLTKGTMGRESISYPHWHRFLLPRQKLWIWCRNTPHGN